MGFGKTKIMTAMAELHEADLILITTEKSKMLERDNEGEFPAELAAACLLYTSKRNTVRLQPG